MSVPLKANELLLPAQGAELQQLVSWKFLKRLAFYVQRSGVRQRWRDSRRSDMQTTFLNG